MDYDREEQRRRRAYEEALTAQRQQQAKLDELKRSARAAKSRLLSSTTKSETWHRMTLASLDREAGYDGEMASARVHVRSLPMNEYIAVLAPFARAAPAATNLEIEIAAVKANLADWTKRGDALILDRARRAYAADNASFATWRRDHPDHEAWRKKAPTRPQGFLISRMAAALGVEPPTKMNRGEAHDWIADRGGNPRFAIAPDPMPTPPAPTATGMPASTAPAQAGTSVPATIAAATVQTAVNQRDDRVDAPRRDQERSW